MALQIITGDLMVDKKSRIISHLLGILEEKPNALIYYIVPDHLKFDMEKYVLENIQALTGQSQSAMINLQVVSFSRLAWYLIQPQDANQLSISEVGLAMIIKQILTEQYDNLIVFKSQLNHQGFIDKLLALFNELIEGNIEPDDLFNYMDSLEMNKEADPALPDLELQKNKELFLLYSEFINYINRYDITQYDSLKKLENYIKKQETMDNYYMVIDHYHYFNAQQMSLILTLAKHIHSLYITLPLTHSDALSQVKQPLLESSRNTYHQLRQLATLEKVKILPDWDITQGNLPIQQDILTTAQLFKDIQEIGLTISQQKVNYLSPPIEIWQTDTIQTELRHVSNQIHYLVNELDYRYQDIIVMTRDISRFQAIIEPYFQANNIPVFVDNLADMSNHPFVILLKSIMNLRLYNFKYDDIMLVLKSNLIMPDFLEVEDLHTRQIEKRKQVNYFENIILANGYFGYRFNSLDYVWQFDIDEAIYKGIDSKFENIKMKEVTNNWRSWLVSKTQKAFKAWDKPLTGKEATIWLYQLIENLGIKEQFIQLRDNAIAEGDIEQSRRDEQVWQVFINLLEEFHTIYQSDRVDFDYFVELLIAGLSKSTYHIIPTTLDQVTFSSIESPQVSPYKIAFAIGMDENSLPAKQQDVSLLDRKTRESMRESLLPHQYLMNVRDQQYSQELLLTYQLWLKGSQRLYISYSTSVNNQTVRMSPYIQQVANLLNLPVYAFTHNLLDELNHLHTSSFGSYVMEQNLALQIAHHIHNEDVYLSDIQRQILLSMREYGKDDHQLFQSLQGLIAAVTDFTHLPKDIPAKIAIELFGKDMNASVSKIEQYYQDPFSHFLIHGLKLQERKLYELDYARSGDYFHDFLDRFTRRLIDQGVNLKDLTIEEVNSHYRAVQADIDQDDRFNILDSHAKFAAIKGQMDDRLLNFIKFTKEQLQRTRMTTIQSEAIFGINPSHHRLNGFVYDLNSGGRLGISGKIDRIDKASVGGVDYLQIVDYKSGKKDFNLVDAYYGLDLQVLTYLSVALNNYQNSSAFGAFYQPLLHSFLDLKDNQLIAYSAVENFENLDQLQLSKNTLNGFVSLSEEAIQLIDGSIKDRSDSLIYPIKLKKDGSYMASSNVFTPEELSILLQYVHMKFKQAAEEIQSGNIALRPYKDNQYTTSLQKDYRVISGFDATENYSAYRVKNIDKKNVIQQMALELEEDGDTDNEL